MEEARRKEVSKWVRDLVISVVVVPAFLALLQMSPAIIFIGGLCALVILKIWEKHPNLSRQRVVITAIAGLLLCVGLGAADWYFFAQRQNSKIVSIEPNTDPNARGFSTYAVVRLY